MNQDAPIPPPRVEQGPLPLHYAQADPGPPLLDPSHPLIRIGRRLVFAFGCWCLTFGAASAWAQVYRNDAPYWAAWGAGLIALAGPAWRRKG